MPRTPLTPAQRAANVSAAVQELPVLLSAAMAAQSDPNVTPAERQGLWDAVEVAGAVVHRQSRLLAGKSKGG